MGFDITGAGAAFNNAANDARKWAEDRNPLTDKGRKNIGNDARNTVNAAGDAVKAVGNYILPSAQAPTIVPVPRQSASDRKLKNPQGSYYGDKTDRRVGTPERPPIGRNAAGRDGYLPRAGGADTAPLRPGERRNVVTAGGNLVEAVGQKDGSTVYLNKHGRAYALPAGANPADYRMDARPDKYPTLRLQVQAEIETNNGFIHKTPNGTRFFVSNAIDKKGNRVVIEIDSQNNALDGAKARQYQALKSPQSIFKRLNAENPDRGGMGNTLARVKKTADVQGRRIDLAGNDAIIRSTWKPLGGLLSLGGFDGLKNRVQKVEKLTGQEQAAMGVDGTKALEFGTGLGVDAVFAWGGGAVIGKVGKVQGFSRVATTAAQTVVVPAVTTVGNDAADNKLGAGTVKKVAIQVGLNGLFLPASAKSVMGQTAVGVGQELVTNLANGEEITGQSLFRSVVTNAAGARAAHGAMNSTNPTPSQSKTSPGPTRPREASPLKEYARSIQDYDQLPANTDPAKRMAYAERVNEARGEASAEYKAARQAGTGSPESKQLLRDLGGRAERINAANPRDAAVQQTSQPAPRETPPQPRAQKPEPTGKGSAGRQAPTETKPTNQAAHKDSTTTTKQTNEAATKPKEPAKSTPISTTETPSTQPASKPAKTTKPSALDNITREVLQNFHSDQPIAPNVKAGGSDGSYAFHTQQPPDRAPTPTPTPPTALERRAERFSNDMEAQVAALQGRLSDQQRVKALRAEVVTIEKARAKLTVGTPPWEAAGRDLNTANTALGDLLQSIQRPLPNWPRQAIALGRASRLEVEFAITLGAMQRSVDKLTAQRDSLAGRDGTLPERRRLEQQLSELQPRLQATRAAHDRVTGLKAQLAQLDDQQRQPAPAPHSGEAYFADRGPLLTKQPPVYRYTQLEPDQVRESGFRAKPAGRDVNRIDPQRLTPNQVQDHVLTNVRDGTVSTSRSAEGALNYARIARPDQDGYVYKVELTPGMRSTYDANQAFGDPIDSPQVQRALEGRTFPNDITRNRWLAEQGILSNDGQLATHQHFDQNETIVAGNIQPANVVAYKRYSGATGQLDPQWTPLHPESGQQLAPLARPQPMDQAAITQLAETQRLLMARDPALAKKSGSPLIYIMKHGQLPGTFANFHKHFGEGGGGYQPGFNITEKERSQAREAYLTRDGHNWSYYFPVAPRIRNNAGEAMGGMNLGSRGRGPLGSSLEDYYLARTPGLHNTLMGTIHIDGDTATIKSTAKDSNGNEVVLPLKMHREQLEALLHEPRGALMGVRQVNFVATPIHGDLNYAGTLEADRGTIDMAATQLKKELEEMGGSSVTPTQKASFLGLTAGDPTYKTTHENVWKALDHANRRELIEGLPLGSINIAGLGEITLAKNEPLVQVNRRGEAQPVKQLWAYTPEERANVLKLLRTQEYTGGTTVLHVDAGSSEVLRSGDVSQFERSVRARMGPNEYIPLRPTNLRNYGPLKELLSELQNQKVYWAHFGASLTGQLPADYPTTILRDFFNDPKLAHHGIDISWSVANQYMAKNPKGFAEVFTESGASGNPNHVGRVIWGSDTINSPSSRNPRADQAVLGQLEEFGLLGELDHRSPYDAKENITIHNAQRELYSSSRRTAIFRTNPENAQWLANKGYERDVSPPYRWQWDRASNDWKFHRTEDAYNTQDPWWKGPAPSAEHLLATKDLWTMREGDLEPQYVGAGVQPTPVQLAQLIDQDTPRDVVAHQTKQPPQRAPYELGDAKIISSVLSTQAGRRAFFERDAAVLPTRALQLSQRVQPALSSAETTELNRLLENPVSRARLLNNNGLNQAEAKLRERVFGPVGKSDIALASTLRKALNQLVRPRGFFFGATTHAGGIFGIVPRKALTVDNTAENRAVLKPASVQSIRFYGATPGVKEIAGVLPPLPDIPLPWGGVATGKYSVVGTAGFNRSDDAGVNITYTVPTPMGKVALWINLRQDVATLGKLHNQLKRGVPPETAQLTANFGAMYDLSPAVVNMVTAANPALGQALKAAGTATGTALYVGFGDNARINFHGDTGLVPQSIWINDIQVPLPQLIEHVGRTAEKLESLMQTMRDAGVSTGRSIVQAHQDATLRLPPGSDLGLLDPGTTHWLPRQPPVELPGNADPSAPPEDRRP